MAVPKNVRHAYKKLDAESQKAFRREYNRRAKSTLVAYVAWFLFGCHYAYLGNLGIQIAFWLTVGFAIAGWVIDFFRIPGMISRYNEELARSMMADYKMMA